MYALIHIPFTALCYVIHKMPYFIQAVLAKFVEILWFDILRIRRKDSIKNVQRAFPDMPYSDAKKIARKSLFHMGLTLVEFFSMPFLWGKEFREIYEVEGEEHLKAALKEGKGVFGLSLHLGNGDMGAAALASWGYPVKIISKIFKTKWLNDLWFSARKSKGLGFIPPRKSSYEILKSLKKNEVVIFVLDQYTGPPNGILTKFFDIETGTAMGLALFAQRSGAPVLPIYTYRIGPKKHKIVIMEPIPFESQDTKEESLRFMTQKYTGYIEEAIRRNPEQWMWVHRRWKLGFEGQNFIED